MKVGVATALLTEIGVLAGGSVARVLAVPAAQSVALTVNVDTIVTVTIPSVPIATVGVTRVLDALTVGVAVTDTGGATLDCSWRRR